MSRTATLPPIRIEPETKATLESVLREGESLTQFIEQAVRSEAEYRAGQQAAVARARESLRAVDEGEGVMTSDEFLARMQQRAESARARIRTAVAARSKRAAG